MTFSPDGHHFAYQVKHGDKWSWVVDGQAGPAYDDFVVGSRIFTPDGVLEFLAIKDGSLYRVQYIPAK
jgi:hypothetical protein